MESEDSVYNLNNGKKQPVIFYRMFCCLVSLLGSSIAHADKPDAITSFTGGGLGYVSEALEISQHFPGVGDEPQNPFIDKELQDTLDKRFIKKDLPLSWNLGFGYTYLFSSSTDTRPAVSDSVFSGKFGIGWQATPIVDVSVAGGLDDISSESYRHGWGVLHFGYLLTFGTKPPKPPVSPDSEDAAEYFMAQRDKKMNELERRWLLEARNTDDETIEKNRIKNTYPRLMISCNFGFHGHGIKYEQNPIQYSLVQYQYGLDLVYSPHTRKSYRIAVNHFAYTSNVDNFAALLKLGVESRVPGLPIDGVSLVGNELLSFGEWQFLASVHWNMNMKEDFDVTAAGTFYAVTGQNPTLSLYPVYSRQIYRRWRLGIGLAGTLGGAQMMVAGSLGLTYRL